ncbi:hypothetical protein ACFQ6E_29855 [Streptomyces sp. NPDC056462]|uniref:hypothetical protein n=1 Tax=Streptomyces sp. NPDC056462 TaxID=3345826 RepID=UPI0036A14F1A
MARTLVEQCRQVARLLRLTDVLMERFTSRTTQDAAFELERRDRERELTVERDEESRVELLQRLAHWLIRQRPCSSGPHGHPVPQLRRQLLPSMPYVAAQSSPEEILRHRLVRGLRPPHLPGLPGGAGGSGAAGEGVAPRSRAKAPEPADLGPIVLELLPSPEGLDENLNGHFAEQLDPAPPAAHPRLTRVNTFTASLRNAGEPLTGIDLVAPASPHSNK